MVKWIGLRLQVAMLLRSKIKNNSHGIFSVLSMFKHVDLGQLWSQLRKRHSGNCLESFCTRPEPACVIAKQFGIVERFELIPFSFSTGFPAPSSVPLANKCLENFSNPPRTDWELSRCTVEGRGGGTISPFETWEISCCQWQILWTAACHYWNLHLLMNS